MGIVTEIFEVVASTITEFANCLTNSVTAITGMFYSPENGLTLIGVLSVIAIGVGLVYFAFRLIKGLVSQRAR